MNGEDSERDRARKSNEGGKQNHDDDGAVSCSFSETNRACFIYIEKGTYQR